MRSNLESIFPLFELAIGMVLITSFRVEQGSAVSNNEQDVHFLMRDSFTLRSVIRRQGDESHPFVSINLKERYSFKQKRARITYQVGDSAKGDFIYEVETGASIDHQVASESCEGSSLDKLFHRLYQSDTAFMFDLMTTRQNHVVGPAKFLSIVCSEAKELTQNYWPAGERTMRNMPTIEFLLRIKTNRTKPDARMLIYYNHDTFSQDKVCQLVPLQILIKFPDKGRSIVVDYFEHELNTIENENTFNNEIVLDDFAFPVGLDCLQSFESKVELFSEAKLDRFSFEASVSWLLDVPKKYFVVYDRRLGMMRINENEDEDSTQILLDFNLNRKCTCFGPLESSNCFTIETDQVTAPNPSLSQLLLGSNGPLLSYMGRALVRNIEAQVYEVYLGDTLPLWFTQPTLVRHGQNYKLRQSDRMLEGSSTGSYLLTVYVVANQSPLDLQVLQLDIHNLNQQPSLACILKAQFFNFHNALASGESINDLTQRNIFALDLGGKSGTKVELLLGGEINLNLKRDYGWLNNWVTRYDALLTSLVNSLKLPTMFIHDLDSRLDKTSVKLSFRLANPSEQKLYTFSYLGQYELNKEVDLDNFIQVKAQTLSGCLALLSKCQHSNLPVFLFYSERRERCLTNGKIMDRGCSVDLRLVDGAFKLVTKGFGEMYMIEWQPDLARKKQSSFIEDNNFHQLEEGTVALRDPYDGESGELQLDVVRVKVDKNWQLDGGKSDSFTLAGFGLPVQANVREADTQVGSLQQCEAACIRDTNCQMYSYCVRHSQAKCMLSNVSISDDQTIADKIEDISKIKPGEQLLLSQKKLKVERHSRCQLNQKLYLDLFIKTPPEEISITRHEVIPVSSREGCAKLCFLRSLKVLQESSHQNFCGSFKYLDNRMLNDWQDQAIKLLTDGKLNEHLLCLLDADVEMDLSQHLTMNSAEFVRNTLFKPEFFKFDYTTLYEQTYGYSLVDSLGGALYFDKSNKSRVAQENYQLRTMHGRNDCAENCFKQTSGLSPACNSFDYISSSYQSQDHRQNFSCHLNTLSLNSFEFNEREKLMSPNKRGEHINKWHYEPRFHTFNQPRTLPSDYSEDSLKTQPHSLLIWLVTFSGIISGLLLAYQLDKRLRIHPPDKLDSSQLMNIQLSQQ